MTEEVKIEPPNVPHSGDGQSGCSTPKKAKAEIVELEGLQNMNAWHKSLLASLSPQQHELLKGRNSSFPPPMPLDRLAFRQWRKDRRDIKRKIKKSISQRVARLIPSHRRKKHPILHQDPRTLYDAVMGVMRSEADNKRVTSVLVRDLCDTKLDAFPSLAAYQSRLQHLRHQLALLGCDPGDRFMVFLALSGLGKSRRRLADALLRQACPADVNTEDRDSDGEIGIGENGELLGKKDVNLGVGTVKQEGSWDRLMEHFSVYAIKEPSPVIREKAEKLKREASVSASPGKRRGTSP